MSIISDLYNYKSNYFLSIKDDETICCGGGEGGRYYGMIEIQLLPDVVMINKTVSNGISSSMILSPERYSSATDEYKLAVKLFKEVNDYLSKSENRIYQDENRTRLMAHTQNLLPQDSGRL